MGKAMELTSDTFKAETASGVVLVDFWAPWCGPCKMIAPTIEQLADEYDGKAKVCKVNLDEEVNRPVGEEFQISAIPTLLVFKDGEIVKRFVGSVSKANLVSALDAAL